MRVPKLTAFAAAVLVVAGCNEEDVTGIETGDAGLALINATQVPLDIVIDARVAFNALPPSHVFLYQNAAPGTRAVQFRSGGSSGATVTLDAADGEVSTAYAVASAGTIAARVIADTGAIVPPGKSKLRVTNLAPNLAGLTIKRTQPDFQTPIAISTPFPYETTSPYLQSDPGTWRVMVIRESTGDTVATTGPVDIPAGEKRSVVLVDSAGVLRFRVLP